jgi:cytoskeletal protein CcmA (bactofilin family)
VGRVTVRRGAPAVERIILRKTSKVVGDLKMAGVVIEDGANFKGNIDITQPQGEAPPAPAVTAKPPASQVPVKVFPEAAQLNSLTAKRAYPPVQPKRHT